MHVAAVQFDIAWENKAANQAVMERMVRDAGLPRGSYVLLPELGDTGFSFDLDVIVDDRTLPWARGLAADLGVWIQVGYATRAEDGRGRNCASIVTPDGGILGTYEKVHPFSFGREAEHYDGGGHVLVASCDDAAVAPLICYDLRFPELWRHATLAGAEVFTIGASWPATRQHHWRALLIARAIENQAYVVAVNRTGDDPHLKYAGGSMIIAPSGEILAESGAAPTVLAATLDLSQLRAWRGEFPAIRDIRRGLLGSIPIVPPIPGKVDNSG